MFCIQLMNLRRGIIFMISKVNLLKFVLYFLLVLFLFFFLRLFFFWNNYENFQDITSAQILISFFQGLRFDAASILMTNLPVFVILLLPNVIYKSLPRFFNTFSSALFVFVNVMNLLINMGDSEYYKFIGRRLTAGTFVIFEDMQAQFLSTITYYWKLGLVFLFAATFFILAVKKINKYTQKRDLSNAVYSYINSVFLYMVFAGFTVLGIRSGFDVRPLSPGHAFIGRSYNEGNLVLNSSFTLLRSLGRTIIEPYNFFNKTDDYIPFLEDLTLSAIPRKNNNKNIVLIIMESFNLSYMSFPNSYKGYTPFLDELATKSVFFINHYSNAMNSIGASLPLLCGFPSIMPGPPFVSSVFRSNKMQGIGNVLKKNNYETSFFHGGRNGTMAFDIAAGLAGIDN